MEFTFSLKKLPGDDEGVARSRFLDRQEMQGQSPELGRFLREPVMITASPDRRAVMIYSLQQWEHLVPRLWKLPKDNDPARRFMQIFFGYAYRLDAAEQITLSEALSRYARLEKQQVRARFDSGRQCLSIAAEEA